MSRYAHCYSAIFGPVRAEGGGRARFVEIEGKGASGFATDASTTSNLAQRFERLPLTRWQYKIFLIIATAWLFDSVDLASLTFVLASISNEFSLSAGQAARALSQPVMAAATIRIMLKITKERPNRQSPTRSERFARFTCPESHLLRETMDSKAATKT